MEIAGIIPARYGSMRFPGKPLAMIGNMSMIERVYRQAEKSSYLKSLAVATDDQRIFDAVKSFGGKVVMTPSSIQTGTERCAHAFSLLKWNAEAVINIQGDEPFLHPEQIDQVASLLSSPGVNIATLVRKAKSSEEVASPHSVKAVISPSGQAIYFSRLPVPYYKEAVPFEQRCYYLHVGIYGFSIPALQKIVQLKESENEAAESLEQLRWIDNGYAIHTGITEFKTHAVDTPEDLELLKKFYQF
jgi:3-deoxy-manno-octulosonate cytidylyltransferase (CMP-KDO synthetase)